VSGFENLLKKFYSLAYIKSFLIKRVVSISRDDVVVRMIKLQDHFLLTRRTEPVGVKQDLHSLLASGKSQSHNVQPRRNNNAENPNNNHLHSRTSHSTRFIVPAASAMTRTQCYNWTKPDTL